MSSEAVEWQSLSSRTSDQHLPAVKLGLEKVRGPLLFWNPFNQKVKSCSKYPHQKINLPLKPLGQILNGPELLFYLMPKQMQVRSLGHDDPLEKEIVSYSSILVWRIPWTEEPGGLQPTHEVAKSQAWLSDLACTHAKLQFRMFLTHNVICTFFSGLRHFGIPFFCQAHTEILTGAGFLESRHLPEDAARRRLSEGLTHIQDPGGVQSSPLGSEPRFFLKELPCLPLR